MTSMDADTGQAPLAQPPDSSHPGSGHSSSQHQQQQQLAGADSTSSSTHPPVAATDSVPTGLLPEASGGRRGHLDSGYYTGQSASSTPRFFIGDNNATNTQFPFDFEQQGSSWDDVVADSLSSDEEDGLGHQPDEREESPVFTNPSTHPINIPGHSDLTQAHSLYTPPRAYMRRPQHLSTGALTLNATVSTHTEMELGLEAGQRHVASQMPATSHPAQVMGNVLRQQDRAMCRAPHQRPQRRRRARTQSEADGIPGVEEVPPMTRDRSLSAPSILTPAQRHCAQELRRISDEFDRSYHGLDSVYQPNTRDARARGRPASFPSARHSPAWWQRVVQFIFPQEIPPYRSPSRRQPPSPITESEPHLEDDAPTEDDVQH